MTSTALEIIKQAAEVVGEYGEYMTTSAGTTTTLACSTLVNSNLESTEMEDVAVLVESGNNTGEMRFVRRGGLNRTTGVLSTADAFTNAVLSGVSFSTYGRVAPYRRLNVPGLLEALNRGLPDVSVRDIIQLTGVTGQKHYTIDNTVYPWLTEEWRVIAVEYPVTNADDIPIRLARSAWTWVADGQTKKLRFYAPPFKTGDVVNVLVYRPGNSLLRLNATARATVTAGAVTALTVLTGGYYTSTPTVTLSGNATATATVTNNTVTGFSITNAGSGYGTDPPTVTIGLGEWKDQTTQSANLVALSDETCADVRIASAATEAEAYRALASLHAGGAQVAEWLAKAGEADAIVRGNVRRQPADAATGVPNLRSQWVGGRSYGYGAPSKNWWY
jgi:uncharacterized membrane protein